MRPLKKIAFFAVILTGLFSFNKSEKTIPPLNIDNLNALEILSNQSLECRPTSDYMFFVETELVKKSRGFTTVNASIYLMNRASGQYNLLASEHVAVPFHKDMISLDYEPAIRDCDSTILENGDRIIGNTNSGSYCFAELIKNEAVYISYVSAANKLLDLDRAF